MEVGKGAASSIAGQEGWLLRLLKDSLLLWWALLLAWGMLHRWTLLLTRGLGAGFWDLGRAGLRNLGRGLALLLFGGWGTRCRHQDLGRRLRGDFTLLLLLIGHFA